MNTKQKIKTIILEQIMEKTPEYKKWIEKHIEHYKVK